MAESVNERFGTAFTGENIVMTVGAAGGLNVIFKTLLNPGDKTIWLFLIPLLQFLLPF